MDIRKLDDPLSEGRNPIRAAAMGSALALVTLVACAPGAARAQQAAPDAGAAPAPAAQPASPKEEASAAAKPQQPGTPDAETLARQVRELMEQVRLLSATVQQLQAERSAPKPVGTGEV